MVPLGAEFQVIDAPRIHAGVALYYPPQLPATSDNELYLAASEVKNGANLPSALARLQDTIIK